MVRLHAVDDNDTAAKAETGTWSANASSVADRIPSSATERMGIIAAGGENCVELGQVGERDGGLQRRGSSSKIIVRVCQKCESKIIEKSIVVPKDQKTLT